MLWKEEIILNQRDFKTIKLQATLTSNLNIDIPHELIIVKGVTIKNYLPNQEKVWLQMTESTQESLSKKGF